MTTFVYSHHKADTGEVFYIGIGSLYRARCTSARSNHWKAIAEKHGRVVNIVGEFERRQDACAAEVWLIGAWRDAGVELANHTSGGEVGHEFTRETRRRMSRSLQEACKRESTIQKKAATMATPEYREQMAAALRAARARPEVKAKFLAYLATEAHAEMAARRNARAVVRSDGESFVSVAAAARAVGVTQGAIQAVLRSECATAGGYGWSRASGPNERPARAANRRKVSVTRSDGATFSTLKAAADSVGLTPGAIRYAINAGATTGGFLWTSSTPRKDFGRDGSVRVRRGDGAVFDSVGAAAQASGVSLSMVSRVLAGKAKTAGGHTWTYQ